MNNILKIQDLHVSVDGSEILKGVNLEINQGEIHALMGPNGCGKSTMAYALIGHPKYEVTRGKIEINGTDLLDREGQWGYCCCPSRISPGFPNSRPHSR